MNKFLFLIPFSLFLVCDFAANASVIVRAPRVSTRVAPTQIVSQECQTEFFGCMDQFCNLGNAEGGSCLCSDENQNQQDRIGRIGEINAEAERIRGIDLEKVRAGARADIIFGGGTRQYDERGNVIGIDEITRRQRQQQEAQDRRDARRRNLDQLFSSEFVSSSDMPNDISTRTGNDLQAAAREMCRARMPAECAAQVAMLVETYAVRVTDDCKGFALMVDAMQRDADQNLNEANAEVRTARIDTFDRENRFNRGQCLIAFKECMAGSDVCRADWSDCAGFAAADNMTAQPARGARPANQRNTNQRSARAARDDNMSHISAKTLERLGSKRHMCEEVLDQCIAVRNHIWDDFLRDIAPNLRLAELNLESDMRQSCMQRISECVMGRACHDKIGPDGNIDACLSDDGRVARATCKIEIDPCEAMEPDIWQYVVARLRALGADRCMEEVKTCFTRPFPMGCGDDFAACVGVDFLFMQNMCPPSSLPICGRMFRERGRDFSMADLDSILMGLYLNVDNRALENCQNVINTRMMELCGSTTDCDRFAADDDIGTGSLRAQKSGNIYRITGMISFGRILMGDTNGGRVDRGAGGRTQLGPGQIGVQQYIAELRERHRRTTGFDAGAVIDNIEAELHNIAGTINRTIEIIASDPHIQNCIGGRSLQNVTGENRTMTARFPNLLANTQMIIAAAALRRAQDNYNRKFNEEVASATASASLDLAQYMCQKMAAVGIGNVDGVDDSTELMEPFAIYFEIGAGLDTVRLTQGGTGQVTTRGVNYRSMGQNISGGGMTRDINALFNRQDRICRICTTTVVTSVQASARGGFLGIGKRSEARVTTSEPVENCQEIKM